MYYGIVIGVIVVIGIIMLVLRSGASKASGKRVNQSNNLNGFINDLQSRQLEIVMDGIERKVLDDRIHLNAQDQLVLGNQENADAVRALCNKDEKILSLVKGMIEAVPARATETGRNKIKSNGLLFVTSTKWKSLGGW